jgi:hypothetical protein
MAVRLCGVTFSFCMVHFTYPCHCSVAFTSSTSFAHCLKSQRHQMFARFSQLARHLFRPLPNYAHRSAAASPGVMTSDTAKNMIHTAACLIIGDEVLGGKVSSLVGMDRCMLIVVFNVDR